MAPNLVYSWRCKADLLGGLAGRFSSRIPVVWGILSSILDPHRTPRGTLLARRICALNSGWLPKRIVVTDAGDSARIVRMTGRVTSVRDPKGLSEIMGSLVRLPGEERRALGQAARDRIATHYELGAVGRQFEKLYPSLISGAK